MFTKKHQGFNVFLFIMVLFSSRKKATHIKDKKVTFLKKKMMLVAKAERMLKQVLFVLGFIFLAFTLPLYGIGASFWLLCEH